MIRPVPELHRDLLEKEVVSLRPDDLERIVRIIARLDSELKPTGREMIDELLCQVRAIHSLLEHSEEHLSPRERSVATAALKYFLKDNDYISDDLQGAGLIDDALVVQAAYNELHPLIQMHSAPIETPPV